MANIVASASGGNWNATGTWVGGVVPGASDNVQLTSSSGNVTINVAAACRSLDCTGYTGTLTHASAIVLSIGDSTAGLSNIALKLVAGMTYTLGSATTSTISFVSTSATQQTVDYGGKTGAAATFNGAGGSWQLTSAINFTQTSGSLNILTLTAGSLDTNGQSITCARILVTGSSTRSLSLGASVINIKSNGGGNVWDATTTTGLTFNAGTSSITAAETNTTFVGGGLTYYNLTISHSSGGSFSITGDNTFNNLSSINSGNNTRLSLGGNQTVNGTFSATGASSTAIGFIYSTVRGAQRTLTVATLGTVNNIVLQDVVAAGAAGTWNLTAQTVGDGGGNSGITFPTGITHYLVTTATSNWNVAANWKTTSGGATTTAHLPLPQDTVVFDANSFNATGRTFTINAQVTPTLDFRNVTNSPTLAFTITAGILYLRGSLYLPSTVTVSGTTSITFCGRSTDVLMTNGVTITNSIALETPGGSVTLQDALTASSNLVVTYGTFNANNFNVTIPGLISSNANTRTITMGTGTWTLTGSATTIWDIGTTTTGLTFNRGSAIICNYSGSTGTRIINNGDVGEASAPSFSITAGTDTLTIQNSRIYNLDFTGFTGTLTNSARGIYGSLTYSSGMTLTGGTNAVSFYATSGTQVLTSNGQTQDFPLTLLGAGGTVQLADDLTVGATRALTITNGTFDANNKNVSIGTFASSGTLARSVLMGSGTWSLTNTTATTVWNLGTSTAMTLSASSATIAISTTSTNTRTMALGGLTYGTITYTVAGSTGALTILTAVTPVTIGTINFSDATNARTLTFQANRTFNITNFNVRGTSGNLVTLNSDTSGTAHTLSKASGVVYDDYLSVKDSTATGGARWFAGANSTNVSGNTGWFFTTPTQVHSTDANKRKATTVTHTTSASKKVAGLTRSHTTDAFKKILALRTHNTNALKRTANVKTQTTDALKRTQNTKSHSTDTNKRRSYAVTHTTDSNKKKTLTVVFTTDALKRKQVTKTHTTDANKRNQSIKTHTTDSNTRLGSSRTHTTDTNKRVAGLLRSHTTDTLLRRQITKTHSTDALKRKANTVSHTTSALKRGQTVVAHTTDSNKRRTITVTHTTGANRRKTGLTKTHTTSASKRVAGLFRTHTTDTFKKSQATRSHTTDTVRYVVGVCVWVSPANFALNILTSTPLVFIIPRATGAMHFHLQIDTVSSFDNLLQEYKSWLDQTNWEYWNGSAWVAIPVGGIDPSYAGNQARFTPNLTSGTYYRRVRGRVLL
jgi:hypothetical protein